MTESAATRLYLDAMLDQSAFRFPDGAYSLDAAHRAAHAIIDRETADLTEISYGARLDVWRERRLATKAA